jgi:hypothetical protein
MTSFVDHKYIVQRLPCQESFFPALKYKFMVQTYSEAEFFESYAYDPEKAFRSFKLGGIGPSGGMGEVVKIDDLTIERLEAQFYSNKYRVKETGDIFYSWHSDIALAYQDNYKKLQPTKPSETKAFLDTEPPSSTQGCFANAFYSPPSTCFRAPGPGMDITD